MTSLLPPYERLLQGTTGARPGPVAPIGRFAGLEQWLSPHLATSETVELVAEGLANKAIAARLGVSVRTVEGHLNHVFTKLGVESRTELVRYVLTQGWVTSAPRREQES